MRFKFTIIISLFVAFLLAGCQSNSVQTAHSSKPVHAKLQPYTLDHSAPKILVSETPVAIVEFDGAPMYGRIHKKKAWVQPLTELVDFALNTNSDVFRQKSDGQLFLRIGEFWWTSPSIEQDWVPTDTLPEYFVKLPMGDEQWLAAYNSSRTPQKQPELKVVNSFEPIELIQMDGPAQLHMVSGTALQQVKNSQQLLFKHSNGQYFALLSGRWFSTDSLTGATWHYATPALPEDFQNLPVSDFEKVRKFVPGTKEAVKKLEWMKQPHPYTVARDLEIAPVDYILKPRFVEIPGTKLKRAVNTYSKVIQDGYDYYRCDKRIWAHSDDPVNGWQPALSLPRGLSDIPTTSPLFHCRFLSIGEQTDAEITYLHSPEYGYHYLSDGVVVDGIGSHLPADRIYEGFYESYAIPIAHPQTYGQGKTSPMGIRYKIENAGQGYQRIDKSSWHDLLH